MHPYRQNCFCCAFTGDQAIVGIPMSHCAELAVSQANEQDDLPFRLVFRLRMTGPTSSRPSCRPA
ncbi:MAG: hypothetical protein U0401_30315 [Anaerolineae bacterium]